MTAVSDTGPLNYLVQIRRVDLLAGLFEGVLIPPAVIAELSDAGTPEVVRAWCAALPAWVTVREPSEPTPIGVRGAGEIAAIALAAELGLPLLCDDLPARRIALRKGLALSGTLGVLQRAYAMGLDDIGRSLSDLAQTNFHKSEGFFERIESDARRMREDRLAG